MQYILDYLFEIGPTKGETPLEGPDLVAWEHLLGIEWQPWQSRLLIRLSRAYIGETHRARKYDAEPPWPEFKRQWAWVQRQKGERRLDAFLR